MVVDESARSGLGESKEDLEEVIVIDDDGGGGGPARPKFTTIDAILASDSQLGLPLPPQRRSDGPSSARRTGGTLDGLDRNSDYPPHRRTSFREERPKPPNRRLGRVLAHLVKALVKEQGTGYCVRVFGIFTAPYSPNSSFRFISPVRSPLYGRRKKVRYESPLRQPYEVLPTPSPPVDLSPRRVSMAQRFTERVPKDLRVQQKVGRLRGGRIVVRERPVWLERLDETERVLTQLTPTRQTLPANGRPTSREEGQPHWQPDVTRSPTAGDVQAQMMEAARGKGLAEDRRRG
jgi:hypothetical protein